jgi:transcriptional regulator with XRE-family HTH domain
MTIVEITGGMLRAARSLTGLSQQQVADRAYISRPAVTA